MSAEDKWGAVSDLVLLLPHGFEGQGPEHSSARLERFLQGCRGQRVVANLTTPAQYFHALRRQRSRFAKPLILMAPKSLLRHKSCVSELKEFTKGRFEVFARSYAGSPHGYPYPVFWQNLLRFIGSERINQDAEGINCARSSSFTLSTRRSSQP